MKLFLVISGLLLSLSSVTQAQLASNECTVQGKVLRLARDAKSKDDKRGFTKGNKLNKQMQISVEKASHFEWMSGASLPVFVKGGIPQNIAVDSFVTLTCDPTDYTRNGQFLALSVK
ncbi:MAG: hypothetical protein K2X47_18225 [Bdellovibrionales bacterium]|nr:hypothetical protein [Bdellovibrionales bacterium]